jgi:hypothetical protein
MVVSQSSAGRWKCNYGSYIKFYIFIRLLLNLVINNIINVILKLFIDHFMLVPIKYLCHVYIKAMLMF